MKWLALDIGIAAVGFGYTPLFHDMQHFAGQIDGCQQFL